MNARRKFKRQINKVVRDMNRSLRADVFGDRFYFHISRTEIIKYPDNSGYYAFILVDFIDKEQPERNTSKFYTDHELMLLNLFSRDSFQRDVNNFIVESNFWKNFKR